MVIAFPVSPFKAKFISIFPHLYASSISVFEAEFIDAETGRVSLYTDKKNAGVRFTNQDALLTIKTRHYTRDSIINVITPVMGLNEKLGVLVIKFARNK